MTEAAVERVLLTAAIALAAGEVTPCDVAGWFKRCNVLSPQLG